MVLATTALLLQFLAIPNASLASVAAAPTAAAEMASVQPEKPAAPLSTPEPGSNLTYAPGRLVPELVLPSTPVEPASFSPPAVGVILSSQEMDRRDRWEERQKKIWLGLSILSSSAATFDAWSTRRVVSSGRGQESNPLLRPFARNNSLYAAIQVSPLLLDYVGRRMLTSHHAWMRHTWWIPQALGTGVSLASSVSNLRVP